jgi:hypothetical protein
MTDITALIELAYARARTVIDSEHLDIVTAEIVAKRSIVEADLTRLLGDRAVLRMSTGKHGLFV